MSDYDVAIVGSGNAALCAAIAAAERGVRTLLLEAGDEDDFGGNSRYTAGAIRFAYRDRSELAPLLVGCSDPRLARADFGSYPEAEFARDLARFAGPDRAGPLQDPALSSGPLRNPLQSRLVAESRPTLAWLVEHGLRLEPIFERQSFERDGRFVFWGGLVLAARGEGPGLVMALREIATRLGAGVRQRSRVVELVERDARVCGVRLADGSEIGARSVVLACGGFEASPTLRERHLGPGWRDAIVRGTPLNRGDGLEMALRIGADLWGPMDGCHAVFMDTATPLREFASPALPHLARRDYRKLSYPFGVMLNAAGRRFVDEGADFRNYTYAQYGRAVLEQPGRFAWQVFDAQVEELLYPEYRAAGATSVEADSLPALSEKLEGVDAAAALATLREFNASVDAATPFDPSVRDGRCARLELRKSNWALALERPPFRAFRVACGITFTYGGLRIRPEDAAVPRQDPEISSGGRSSSAGGPAIPGLYAAGELVGGVFEGGYPGGAGLSSGAVYGRTAGAAAAAYSLGRR